LAWIAPALLGLVSGLAGAAIFWQVVRPQIDSTPNQPASLVVNEKDESRRQVALQDFTEAARSLEQAVRAAGPAPADVDAGAHREEPAEMTPDEMGEQTELAHEQLVSDHGHQPRDARWALEAEHAFRQDFANIPNLLASDTKVDCRSKSCTVELQWQNFDAAVANYGKVLSASFRTNCAEQIVLPQPTDPGRPYRATVYFDCESPQNGGT
jgi:hypothetical protein